MKKLAVLCLATIVALCSFAQKGQVELKKGNEFYEQHLYTDAVSYFKKAAEQGNIEAQYKLGLCYFEGKGEIQDYNKAKYWLEKPAVQGNVDAQYKLGYCYSAGKGPAKDEEAVYWFKKAAEQGHELAQLSLGISYMSGKGVPKDNEQAKYWFEKLVKEKDNALAKAMLDSLKKNNR